MICQEIDELVDEWTPKPLGGPLTPEGRTDLASVPVISGADGPRPQHANTCKQYLHLICDNFPGLAGNETMQMRAIESLRKYSVGSCVPSGF